MVIFECLECSLASMLHMVPLLFSLESRWVVRTIVILKQQMAIISSAPRPAAPGRRGRCCWAARSAVRTHAPKYRWTGSPEHARLQRRPCRTRAQRDLGEERGTVVLEEGSTEGVDVGPGVLDLADGAEDARDGLEAEARQVADVVVLDVLVGEALQVHEPRVSVAQHRVAVPRDHLALAQRLPHVLLDDLLAGLLALVVVLELSQPLQALLVGQPVQRTRQAVDGGREGEVGVGEGGADEVGGVGGDVAALVVGVDGDIAAEALLHLELLEAEHVSEVARPVQIVVGRDEARVVVLVAVDGGAQQRQLGQQVHGVLEVVLPVLGLVGARLVGAEELALRLQVQQPHRQHRHRVELPRQISDERRLRL